MKKYSKCLAVGGHGSKYSTKADFIMMLLTAKTTTSLPSRDSPVSDIEINRGSFQEIIIKFIKTSLVISIKSLFYGNYNFGPHYLLLAPLKLLCLRFKSPITFLLYSFYFFSLFFFLCIC